MEVNNELVPWRRLNNNYETRSKDLNFVWKIQFRIIWNKIIRIGHHRNIFRVYVGRRWNGDSGVENVTFFNAKVTCIAPLSLFAIWSPINAISMVLLWWMFCGFYMTSFGHRHREMDWAVQQAFIYGGIMTKTKRFLFATA